MATLKTPVLFSFSTLFIFFSLTLLNSCAERVASADTMSSPQRTGNFQHSLRVRFDKFEPTLLAESEFISDEESYLDRDDYFDEDQEMIEEPTDEELEDCFFDSEVNNHMIRFEPRKSNYLISSPMSWIAVKVHTKKNNHQRLLVSLPNSKREHKSLLSVRGLCVIDQGEHAQLDIEIENLVISEFRLLSKGIKAKANLVVEAGSIIHQVNADILASESSFEVSGSGSYSCGEFSELGLSTSVRCQTQL